MTAHEPSAITTAGQSVEVIDARSPLHGKIGTVAFFVADNVYVRFASRRFFPTQMFFVDQLRAVAGPQHSLRRSPAVALLHNLRLSLTKLPR